MVSSNKKTNITQNCQSNVLIVDTDRDSIRTALVALAAKGIGASVVNTNDKALDFINKNDCDIVFGSFGITPSKNAFELLRAIHVNNPEMPVVLMHENNNNTQELIDSTVKAINMGCCDCLTKPLDNKNFETLLDRLLPNQNISMADCVEDGTKNVYRIIGKSAELIQSVKLAKKIAATDVPVLISAPSGTGKELFASLIHHKSQRVNGPYIKVNCAALSDSLLESELFGHEKGAFTGAISQRKGRFEMAHGGTLLLDEITETPPNFQAKLLRVLEEQEFERLGSNENIKVNVRIISTTNKDMLSEIQLGNFRQDLYYRLCGVRLMVPALEKRKDDLRELVWYFVNIYARQANRKITSLSDTMMEIFEKYNWPGNVRQLRNVVRTCLVLGSGPILSMADVSWLFDELQPKTQQNCISEINDRMLEEEFIAVPLTQIERQAILQTLEHTNGNQTKAAKILGISDRTLRDKVKRYKEQELVTV